MPLSNAITLPMSRNPSIKASPQGERKPNWANRTVFQCDGLEALRGMNTATVDLIIAEFKGAGFYATRGKVHTNASFQKRWVWAEDIYQKWMEEIQDNLPSMWQAINAAQAIHGPGMGSFLSFMGIRLIEMHRILQPTGSIYLHCDHPTSHYLKLLMDAIFSTRHFRNEIAWCHRETSGRSNKAFLKKHDVLLFYARSKDATFEPQYTPYSAAKRHAMEEEFDYFNNIARVMDHGAPMPDWWDDIAPISVSIKGKFRFRKQPIALYERIIRASSNKGDIVLDPFYTHPSILIAAENLERQWVAINWKGQEDFGRKGARHSENPPERTDG